MEYKPPHPRGFLNDLDDPILHCAKILFPSLDMPQFCLTSPYMSFSIYLWIGLGGALGSVLRGALNQYIPFHVQVFSWSTFIVNMLGCLLIGLLWVKLENEMQKAFWITGVLGGLTTFSGLGLELMRYLNEKNIQLAVLYGCSSLIIGILLVWFGQKLASL